MHIAGKGIWHHTKTFAMEQEILMELYSMSSSLLRKISAGALMHIVNIIIYGKLQTSVRIQIKCIYESIVYFQYFDFCINMNCHMNHELWIAAGIRCMKKVGCITSCIRLNVDTQTDWWAQQLLKAPWDPIKSIQFC